MGDSVVHNLPPDNGADKDPDKWENSYEKDRRNLPATWDTAKREKSRKTETPLDFDPAASAEVAQDAAALRKKRKIAAPDKGDPRNFEYYQKQEDK